MKFHKIYFTSLFVLIIFSSCSTDHRSKISGKWKVEETGIKSLEITYEFKADTLLIEDKMDKSIADSLEMAPIKKFESIYSIRKDSASAIILEVTDIKNGVKGEYIITVLENKMTLIDPQSENIRLTRIN
jgi:hypothetical protein